MQTGVVTHADVAAELHTDPDGQALFERLPSGVELHANGSHADFLPQTAPLLGDGQELTLVEGTTIRGTVQTREGKHIAGVAVFALQPGLEPTDLPGAAVALEGRECATTVSGADGHFSLRVREGASFRLLASGSGWHSSPPWLRGREPVVRATAGEGHEVVLQVVPMRALACRLMTTETRTPVLAVPVLMELRREGADDPTIKLEFEDTLLRVGDAWVRTSRSGVASDGIITGLVYLADGIPPPERVRLRLDVPGFLCTSALIPLVEVEDLAGMSKAPPFWLIPRHTGPRATVRTSLRRSHPRALRPLSPQLWVHAPGTEPVNYRAAQDPSAPRFEFPEVAPVRDAEAWIDDGISTSDRFRLSVDAGETLDLVVELVHRVGLALRPVDRSGRLVAGELVVRRLDAGPMPSTVSLGDGRDVVMYVAVDAIRPVRVPESVPILGAGSDFAFFYRLPAGRYELRYAARGFGEVVREVWVDPEHTEPLTLALAEVP